MLGGNQEAGEAGIASKELVGIPQGDAMILLIEGMTLAFYTTTQLKTFVE